MPLPTFEF